MSFSRQLILIVLVLSSLAVFSGCTDSGTNETFKYLPIYGDGSADLSDPVVKVGDVTITQDMMDARFAELPPRMQSRYKSEEGRVLLLNLMINETIMVLGAVDEELYNEKEVARNLLAQRRITLDSAMRNIGIINGKEPSEEQVRDYFLTNKDKYRRVDTASGRHVECLTRDDANKAYQRLVSGGANNNWPHVINDLSINVETKKRVGEFGWFNEGSFLPQMDDADAFTTAAIKLDVGLHEPILIANHWHVIEILKKEFARTMTFNEAKVQVKMDMMGSFQYALIRDYLKKNREELTVTFLGEFAPGSGLSADEIFNRAMLITDEVEKIDMLSVIIEDFPDHERADDALFWAGTAALDAWSDRGVGRRYLEMLVEEYPESELVDQARFLLDNMDNPGAFAPKSIEELRSNAQ